jgi:type IV pilus assembly protein PilY1
MSYWRYIEAGIMRPKDIMNISRHSLRFWASAILFLLFGLAGSPAGASPAVDQTPLTVATALPPNFVLMLDDSGSMAWDVMPDYSYLQNANGTSCVSTPNCLDSSDVNGVYYNPNVPYNPPMTVDGVTRMAPASFTAAHVDGFDSSSDVFDLRSYNGSDDSSGGQNKPTFSKTVSGTVTTSYPPTLACNSGDGSPLTSGPNAGQCRHATTQSTIDDGCQTQAQCNTDYANASNTVGGSLNWSGSKDTKNNNCGINKKDCTWKIQNYSYYAPSPTCPAGGTLSGGQCQTTATSNYGFFIYTVQTVTGTPPNATISYTTYYVGASGSCAAVSATISASVCKDDAATQQNVANWFSYYHTRILMAKSGLMEAFSSLDPTIRFGYGSINGSQASWIQSTYGSSLSYPFSTDTKSSNYLAKVQPFGSGSSTTSQKSQFWNWVTNESPNGFTPLRQALNAVGQYYMTDQPWQSSSSDHTKLACRQAYTILTTDGFWNESSVSIPSNSYSDNIDGGPGTTTTSTTTSSVDDGCKTQAQCNTDFANASNKVSGTESWSGTKDSKGNSCGSGTGSNQKKDCS